MMEKSGPVLVIEDEPGIRLLLREILEADGHEVITLSSPEMIDTIDPDVNPGLILVDLMLPGETGLQLARELRDGPFSHTPMIAISADRLALLFAARSGLFQDTIAKPFELASFLETTQHYVGRYVTA